MISDTNTELPCSAIECTRTRLKDYLQTCKFKDWLEPRLPLQFEPFYASFDIRDAGFKLAPVDANLFPAGFNNICSDDLKTAATVLKDLLIRHLGKLPQSLAILPESHTKNRFYADHLFELRQLFRNLGIRTEVGWWHENVSDKPNDWFKTIELLSTDQRTITAYPFWINKNRLVFEPFDPGFILINNDFSSGYPTQLEMINQPLEPSFKLGWHTRKKSTFFKLYNDLATELAEAAHLDPWCVTVETKLVSQVNFDEGVGMERIAEATASVLQSIQEQYKRRGILEKPFVFVKNNSGTYGMGILRVENAEELLKLNRRERNKMAVGKNKLQVTDVIVQEGIPTRFKVDGVYAEPVIYSLGHQLIGGFLRKNPGRGRVDNLNSPGMVFQKLCISDLFREASRDVELELVYGVIAQLSIAAVSHEIEEKVLLVDSKERLHSTKGTYANL